MGPHHCYVRKGRGPKIPFVSPHHNFHTPQWRAILSSLVIFLEFGHGWPIMSSTKLQSLSIFFKVLSVPLLYQHNLLPNNHNNLNKICKLKKKCFYLGLLKEIKLGSSFLSRLRRLQTPHGFSSPWEFQAKILIVLGGVVEQPPLLMHLRHWEQ